MSSTTDNKNKQSSSIIDSILGRKNKSKENGTIIDTATGAPPTDPVTADSDVKKTAALAEQKQDLNATQQNAQITPPTAKQEPELQKQVEAPPATNPEPAVNNTTNATEPASSTTAPTSTETTTPAPTTTDPIPSAAVASIPIPAIAEPPSEPKGKEPATATTDEPDRGRGKEFQSYSAPRQIERSVSPGTMPDGRHAQTAGDRGESYVPGGMLGKLGSKFGLGHR